MDTQAHKKALLSAGWKSYDGWDYNGMKERLDSFMGTINKHAFVQHVKSVLEQPVRIS